MFEPFVEDEVSFDEYCRSMAQEGNWAGHVELQAASLATHSNICIHRHRSPRWHAQNFDVHEASQIHLSYHDGEHYNSVRLKEDTCSGPSRPIFIEENAGLSAKSNKVDVVCTVPEKEGGENILQEKSSNILNATKAQQALNVGGDIVAQVLTAEQESGVHMFVDLVADILTELRVEHKALENDLSSNDVERVCSVNSPRANERNFLKIRPVYMVRKRNTSHVADLLRGNLLLDFLLTKLMIIGRIGKTESPVEKVQHLLRIPFSLMDGHLIWVVHYALRAFPGN